MLAASLPSPGPAAPTSRPSPQRRTLPPCRPTPPLPSWPQSAEPGSTHRRGATTAAHRRLPALAGRAPSDYFLPVYRRHEVSVEHEITLPVPDDARPHDYGDAGAYGPAIAAAIAGATARATGAYAGALLVADARELGDAHTPGRGARRAGGLRVLSA